MVPLSSGLLSLMPLALELLTDEVQISGFTALPGINDKMSQGLLDGIYWVPQIVGGSGKTILLLLASSSRHWIKWHVTNKVGRCDR